MNIKIDFRPQKLERDLSSFGKRLNRNLNLATQEAALLIQSKAKLNIQKGTRTGRLYRRGSITHRASAPGEFPKSDTGRLVSSIYVDFTYQIARVGSQLKYAKWLEDGTTKMAARPWLARTRDENRDQVKNIVLRALFASRK